MLAMKKRKGRAIWRVTVGIFSGGCGWKQEEAFFSSSYRACCYAEKEAIALGFKSQDCRPGPLLAHCHKPGHRLFQYYKEAADQRWKADVSMYRIELL